MGLILVACDDISLQRIVTAEIEAQRHTVITASTGQEVHERVLATKPDMVFLTISLPVFNGLETVCMLREDPDVPGALPVIIILPPTANKTEVGRAKITGILPQEHTAGDIAELLTRHLPPDAMA